MIDLTYIIPFYNGEKTIGRMLESIYRVGLSEDRFEVIIVDDCSPVGAAEVLSLWQKQHSNLRLIRHTENRRQGGAKNTGIRHAQGTYIALADQDDVIIPNHIAEIVSSLLSETPDLALCQYETQYRDGHIATTHPPQQAGKNIYTGLEYCEKWFDPLTSVGPWSIFYKRDYILSLKRPMAENVLMEDTDWLHWHLFFAQKVLMIPYTIYRWEINSTSITHTVAVPNLSDFCNYGYRKIKNAETFRLTSPSFADLVVEDGMWNVRGGVKRMRYAKRPWEMYRHIDNNTRRYLLAFPFDKYTRLLLKSPKLGSVVLFLQTPLRWAYQIKSMLRHQ